MAQRRSEYAARLRNAVQRLTQVLGACDEVERISVFGSYARGRLDLGTDLDVLVIMRTEEHFLERLRRVYSRVGLDVDVDILCYTPEEWEDLQATPWAREMRREEIVIYEKNSG